jgi:Prokaryotic homologs of the JAB domain
MDAEDDLFRPPPPHPYRPVHAQLRVPADAIAATLKLLRRAGRRESGLFWYGPRDTAGNGTVAYVVAPRQRMSWGNYSVSPEALAEVVQRLSDDWKPLAQIHSHPGLGVEHSNYDDRMAISRRALSLVFPRYGRLLEPFPWGVGVHEWQNEYWHLLGCELGRRRVVTVGGSVRVEDLR